MCGVSLCAALRVLLLILVLVWIARKVDKDLRQLFDQ